MKKRRTIAQERKLKLNSVEYNFVKYPHHNLRFLQNVANHKSKGTTFNDIIISIDTETSKTGINKYKEIKHKNGCIETKIKPIENMIVCWTITIASYEKILLTIYGRKPSEMVKCIADIHSAMDGQKTLFFCHNLPYDETFLRQFLFARFGFPVKQLNVKSHYMINIEFENGIMLRDSLIIAQRSLERWAIDLECEHQKAVGFWNYDKIRTQKTRLTALELKYIENDTIALCECLQNMCRNFNKKIYQLFFTATGIPREQVKNNSLNNGWRKEFLKIVPDAYIQQFIEKAFHGGYVHCNKRRANRLVVGDIEAHDFISSYLFAIIVGKYPMTKFKKIYISDYNSILNTSDSIAHIFKCAIYDVDLKRGHPMPTLQKSKADLIINEVCDNGRIESCDVIVTYMCDLDLKLFVHQYNFDSIEIIECYYSQKRYLPKWYRDTVFNFFKDKCILKPIGGLRYTLSKSIANSCFGMACQHPVKNTIVECYEDNEDYVAGEFYIDDTFNFEDEYNKWVKRSNSVLLYQWGIYVTAISQYNLLYRLGSCIPEPEYNYLYSDTDSAYALQWDYDKLKEYNDWCLDELIKAGYGAVTVDGKQYILGQAELDGLYSEFRSCGAKRYCVRDKNTNKLKLTTAGVPKKAVEQLNDNINNYKIGFVFKGHQSGKKTHFHIYQKAYKDKEGNEIADYIDLVECDYLLSSPYEQGDDDYLIEEGLLNVYDEEIL